MSYFRVVYDFYIEGEYETEEEAIADFMEGIEDIKDDITVTCFNEDTRKWE